jgi:phosphate transport system protein
MSHYEERLERDLTRIKQQLAMLAESVEGALEDAVHALLSGNEKLAYNTVLGDQPINRASRALDRMCHGFIALHLPSAGHLRLMSAIIRANLSLERIGDYAVTVCRESVQLAKRPEGLVARELELMAGESRQMLKQAAAAFIEGNADKAKATMTMADQVERTFDTVFSDLVAEGDHFSVKDLFAYLVIFNMLERVSDQAKNICEDTVFAVTGESKTAKVYRVLFLDEDNTLLGPMAEAIARKNFPSSGEYLSAGRNPREMPPSVLAFMQDRGIDLGDHRPAGLDLSRQELAEYHVIVSLQGPVKSYLPDIPFHTTPLEWDVGGVAGDLPEDQLRQRYETLYREIAVQVSNLMTTLRGEEAS